VSKKKMPKNVTFSSKRWQKLNSIFLFGFIWF